MLDAPTSAAERFGFDAQVAGQLVEWYALHQTGPGAEQMQIPLFGRRVFDVVERGLLLSQQALRQQPAQRLEARKSLKNHLLGAGSGHQQQRIKTDMDEWPNSNRLSTT